MDDFKLRALLGFVVMIPVIYFASRSNVRQGKEGVIWEEALKHTKKESLTFNYIEENAGRKYRSFRISFKEYPSSTFGISTNYSFLEKSKFTLKTFTLEGRKCFHSIESEYEGKTYVISNWDLGQPFDIYEYSQKECSAE